MAEIGGRVAVAGDSIRGDPEERAGPEYFGVCIRARKNAERRRTVKEVVEGELV